MYCVNPVSINSNQSFTGYTKLFKNKIFIDGQKDISELIEKNPNRKQIVGQLPKFIFDKLPKENKQGAIREIMAAFGNISNLIRNYKVPATFYSMDQSKMNRPEQVNQILTEVLQKYNIIPKYETINVKYLDKGGKGKAFKLEGLYDYKTEDEFVIKVFHQIKGDNWHMFKSHGCYAEINNAMYWRHHEGFNTQRGKFFWGDFNNGYMITKYIDEDIRAPKRIVDEYKYGIKCTDEEKAGAVVGYNRLKGYNYDYGGMRIVNRLKNSEKICREILEDVKHTNPRLRPAFWEHNFQKKQNSEKIKAGLALGIKYMENKNYYINRCLEQNMALVNRALAYVLKYLPEEDALKYFEKLVKTKDSITQIILFNEVPLLAKKKNLNVVIKDDINIALGEIDRSKLEAYYQISKKHAKEDTIEHLANLAYLLPKDKVQNEYYNLIKLNNKALNERLAYKHSFYF